MDRVQKELGVGYLSFETRSLGWRRVVLDSSGQHTEAARFTKVESCVMEHDADEVPRLVS
jgi:hypothetical protein